MKQNKKHFSLGLHIGSASILVIVVLLCLIFFAALSFISANADSKLSQKVLTRTTAYYNACNEAEQTLAQLDTTLIDAYNHSKNEAEYFQKVGYSQAYTFTISETQYLQVDVELQYPRNVSDSFYSITSWKVITSDS